MEWHSVFSNRISVFRVPPCWSSHLILSTNPGWEWKGEVLKPHATCPNDLGERWEEKEPRTHPPWPRPTSVLLQLWCGSLSIATFFVSSGSLLCYGNISTCTSKTVRRVSQSLGFGSDLLPLPAAVAICPAVLPKNVAWNEHLSLRVISKPKIIDIWVNPCTDTCF